MTRDNTNDNESETPKLNGTVSNPEEWLATEMSRQYRRKMRDKNAAKAKNKHEQNEAPDDPNINRRTGKVLSYDCPQDALEIEILTHTGYVITNKVPWPDDPTDETEPVVRLCRWLSIPITDLTQLKGAYVPLRQWGPGVFKDHDAGSKLQIEIPPVDAPGNRLKYRGHRFLQTHKWANYALPALMLGVACFGWVPIFATVGVFPNLTAAPIPFFLSLAGMVSFVIMIALVFLCLAIALSLVHQRLFPKADDNSPPPL